MKYYLAEACRNKFILFDCLGECALDDEFIKKARTALEEHGRDDVLILMSGREQHERLFARMAVLGLDGHFGEFCGNGARACAAYLFTNYRNYQDYFLISPQGEHALQQKKRGVFSINLPRPHFSINHRFVTSDHILTKYGCFYVEAIEPHLVLPRKLEENELLELGRELNGLKEVFPFGINVNSCHVMEEGAIFVRTYERGVQRLTESCGTGSLACAAWHHQAGEKTIFVITAGGELQVDFISDQVILTGPAQIDEGEQIL